MSDTHRHAGTTSRASGVTRSLSVILTALILLAMGSCDLNAAELRPVKSAEELVNLILDSWREAEAQAEEFKEIPIWKQRQDIFARVGGRTFQGSWLIEALSDKRLDTVRAIRISHSTISGGLNFQLIPATPLASLDLPTHWSAERRRNWLARARASDIAGMHVVKPELRFDHVKFDWSRGQYLTFNARRTLFMRDLSLSDVTLGPEFAYGENNIREAIFAGDVEIEKVRWPRVWDLTGAIAAGRFSLSQGVGDISFENMRFESDASFSDMRAKRAGPQFTNAVFEGPASFSGIDTSVILHHARFRGPALFGKGPFGGDVDLTGAVFEDQVSFQDGQFLEALMLVSTTAKGFLDFRNSRIHELYFRNPKLNLVEGRADFRNARIESLCLQDVVFTNDVDFSDATLGKAPAPKAGNDDSRSSQAANEVKTGKSEGGDQSDCGSPSLASFRFVTFEGNAFFLRTDFLGDLRLADVGFNRAADFTAATLPHRNRPSSDFLFSFVRFSDLSIRWGQLPPVSQWINPLTAAGDRSQDENARMEPLSSVLRRLEASFRSRNLLADANAAHYNAKLAELAEARRSRDLDDRIAIEVEWLIWGIPTGYGTQIWTILGGASVVCLIYALLFSLCPLERQSPPRTTGEFNLRLRLLELPYQYVGDPEVSSRASLLASHRFITALRFSALLLFKFGYRDTVISGKLGFIPVKHIVMTAWLLGFYLLACITITLANTQPLINKLISGVF